MDRQPVASADSLPLHTFDASNACGKLERHQGIVRGFCREPANGAHTNVDRGRSKVLLNKPCPVRLNGRLGETGAGSRRRVPAQEVGDRAIIGSFALWAVDGIEYQRIQSFYGANSRLLN